MKTQIYKVSLWAILGLCLCLHVKAQDMDTARPDSTIQKKYHPVDATLQLRSLYIWRGFRVSNSPISDVDLHYTTRDGNLAVGIWGGEALDGNYKEFSYYIDYKLSAFNFSVWDINNFSDFPNANLFNYNPLSTSHFIDVTAGYQFKDSFPLSINWSTIVAGRDTYQNDKGETKNAYSNYVVLDYRFWKEGRNDLHLFAAGGFAFGRNENFYGSKPNIVNTGVTLDKDLMVFAYHLPVAVTGMFSPEHKYGALQLVVNVF